MEKEIRKTEEEIRKTEEEIHKEELKRCLAEGQQI
jgi:hypothetical protein